MSGKTPGQAAPVTPGRAACEAFWRAVGAGPDQGYGPECHPDAAWAWAQSMHTEGAWEAAATAGAAPAHERIAELVSEGNSLRGQLSEALGKLDGACKAASAYSGERDRLAALLAEVLGLFVTFGRHDQFRRCVLGDEEFTQWLQRAGLRAAIVTARTEET